VGAKRHCFALKRKHQTALKRILTSVTRSDADAVFKGQDEHLPIADFARSGRLDDGGDDFLNLFVRDGNFQLDFGQQVHDILRSPIALHLPSLSSMPSHLRNRHADDADLR
jgi:hypothetical protein